MLEAAAYGIENTRYCRTGNDGRPDDAVWCSQVVEQDSRSTCQHEPAKSPRHTNDDQRVRRIRSTLDQYARKPL